MIRQLDTADWETLRDVRLRALGDAPEAFLERLANAQTFEEERWRDRATARGGQASFVYAADGRDEGMVSCFVADDPKTVFLVAMWVAPKARGTAAARELVEGVLAWARDRGAERVALSVEGENARAARLYEKCGFVATESPPPFPYEPNPGNVFYLYEL